MSLSVVASASTLGGASGGGGSEGVTINPQTRALPDGVLGKRCANIDGDINSAAFTDLRLIHVSDP